MILNICYSDNSGIYFKLIGDDCNTSIENINRFDVELFEDIVNNKSTALLYINSTGRLKQIAIESLKNNVVIKYDND